MIRECRNGRTLICSLPHGADLLDAVRDICSGENIRSAWIQGIGALSSVRFAFYDQDARAYAEKELKGHYEILNLTGNVSLKDGGIMCHCHITAADSEGRAFGGHVAPGCTVFAAEVLISELAGPPLVRKMDDQTGLSLWSDDV